MGIEVEKETRGNLQTSFAARVYLRELQPQTKLLTPFQSAAPSYDACFWQSLFRFSGWVYSLAT